MMKTTVSIGPYQMQVGRPLDAYLPRCYLENGINYEIHVVNKLREVLRPGDTLLDLGANWGFYTLVANWLTEGRVRVISVEPNPWNVEILCQNIRENSISNTVVLSVGASDRFHWLNYQGTLANHLGKIKEAAGDPILLAPMDELLPGIQPNVIKLDIDGGEIRALAGMGRVLSRARALLVEFSLEAIAEQGNRPEDLQRAIESIPGFATVEILTTGLKFSIHDKCGWDTVRSLPICDLCLEREGGEFD